MADDWPRWSRWSEMNWLRLLEGPSGGITLPIAPTMKRIIYRGERYFRMQDARSRRQPYSRVRTPYGGSYLWDKWLPQKLEAAGEDPIEGVPVEGSQDG